MTPDAIIFRSEFHPHPPLQVLDFLKNELKVGVKYVALLSGDAAEHLGRMWLRHINLLCVLEAEAAYFKYISDFLGEQPDLWAKQAALQAIPLDADSVDCAVLLGKTFKDSLSDTATIMELQRVLRLNSFAVGVFHRLSSETERTFSWAFSHFFKQYATSPLHEYEESPTHESLEKFFKAGYEQKQFSNQVRLNWDGLQGYYLASEAALAADDPKFKWAIKALHILFEQYQIEGEVVLDYQTEVYYGLFNKYVPAISLRKNIFFTLLRPFALGFYILVKMNIYFWKMLERMFRRS
jgi:hypothetical protein